MIDLGKIERWAAKVEGPLVAMTKDQLAELIQEVRSGRSAVRQQAMTAAIGGIGR